MMQNLDPLCSLIMKFSLTISGFGRLQSLYCLQLENFLGDTFVVQFQYNWQKIQFIYAIYI